MTLEANSSSTAGPVDLPGPWRELPQVRHPHTLTLFCLYFTRSLEKEVSGLPGGMEHSGEVEGQVPVPLYGCDSPRVLQKAPPVSVD